MIVKEKIRCKCHKEFVRMENVGSKAFPQKKYYCSITGRQLYNNFIHEKVKINLRDPKDDTWDGSEVECPEELEETLMDYKKRASGE